MGTAYHLAISAVVVIPCLQKQNSTEEGSYDEAFFIYTNIFSTIYSNWM